MSDLGRKDMSSKVEDKITPDSSKSTMDKVGDSITGTADHVAREVVPDSEKSTTQAASDKAGRMTDTHSHDAHTHTTGDKSMVDKVKETLHMDKK